MNQACVKKMDIIYKLEKMLNVSYVISLLMVYTQSNSRAMFGD